MVRRSFTKLLKAAFVTLYCAIVRPHLRADVNHLEERLRQLNLFSLQRRHLRADPILAFNIFKAEVDLSPSDVFLRPPRTGLRGHTYRLLQWQSHLRRRGGAFSVWVLPLSVPILKKQLDRQWSEIFPAAPV